jgi:replicative DNA helicase
LAEIQRFKGDLIIKQYPTRGATVDIIRSHILSLRAQDFNPDAIIIDYGDILKSSRSYNDKRHEEGSIFEELRGLAVDLKLPVVTATQANRGALEKRIVTMADIAESFEKAKIADVIIALCQTSKEKKTGKMRWFFAKNRDNKSEVTVPMRLNTDTMFFKQDDDWDEEDDVDDTEDRDNRGSKESKNTRPSQRRKPRKAESD